ncbi:MAG: MerR family transcriptional regulator [Chloroflexi bacterium]|nr:MAG: MerR family transcriptional regulator [Chloroflexota bacterium]
MTHKASIDGSGRLRPVDLAREHGLSTQAVRNYEEQGILPPADRTESGYRVYREGHAAALRAFLALAPAHGHQAATAIMSALNEGRIPAALHLLDESHAQLLEDRRTLIAVDRALRVLAPEGRDDRGPGRPLLIGALARQLRVRPATLRKWERAGIIRPRRDPVTGYRRYDQADVRDARLAQQLRRGGVPLAQVATLVERVREAGGVEPLEATLEGWNDRLTARGLAMLRAAAVLAAYVEGAHRARPAPGGA